MSEVVAENEKRRNILREAGKGLGVLALLVVLMMWLAGAFVSKVNPGQPIEKPGAGKLTTGKVERRGFPLRTEQVGTLRSQTEARVSSRIMAQVKEILVREGDRVVGGSTKGAPPTIMARLDDGDIQARLRQAQSRITGAERAAEAAKARLGAVRSQVDSARANREKVASDYRRYQELQRSHAATGQQVEAMRAQKDMAEAQLQAYLQDVKAAQGDIARIQAEKEQAEAGASEARSMLSYTVIQAPFTGKVLKKMVNVGDMATPGHPLFYVETSTHPELQVSLAESLLPHLQVGLALDVHIDALNRTFKGSLREIVPKADPSTRTVLVKIGLSPDPDLVNGLFGRVDIPYGEYHSLLIPLKAVRRVGQLDLVDVVDPEGYPQRRFVTLGQHHEDLVEVLSGLKENEEVVIP